MLYWCLVIQEAVLGHVSSLQQLHPSSLLEAKLPAVIKVGVASYSMLIKCLMLSPEVPVVTFSELLHYPTKSINTTYLPGIHGDWVAKVLYCPYMEQCMSCSNDSACSLYLVDCHGHKEGSVITVRKGITSFDYSRELNIIGRWGPCFRGSYHADISPAATGGLDRIVRLWNPYIPGKPTALLKGHTTAIVHIVLHSTYGEVYMLAVLISLS